METHSMIKKQKLKNTVRVTFALPIENAASVHLVGDFNVWDAQATSLIHADEGAEKSAAAAFERLRSLSASNP